MIAQALDPFWKQANQMTVEMEACFYLLVFQAVQSRGFSWLLRTDASFGVFGMFPEPPLTTGAFEMNLEIRFVSGCWLMADQAIWGGSCAF